MANFPRILLLPFSLLYGIGIWLRNKCYDLGFIRQESFDLPVLSVGNLSVGGTGKTPHIEYLVELLTKNHYRVAVLSRGYKRSTKGFVLASENSTAAGIGDEPKQISQKFPGITVAVCEQRVEGIRQLKLLSPAPDVILLDDAFQHRKVRPGFSILLTDYSKPFYSDFLLPAGRLREFRFGRKRADMIVVTKSPDTLTEQERERIISRIRPFPHQQVCFSSMVHPVLYSMDDPSVVQKTDSMKGTVVVVAALANPEPLLNYVKGYADRIHPVIFPDHHAFTAKDVEQMKSIYESQTASEKMIVTTEKDAVKLRPLLRELNSVLPVYVLPVRMQFYHPETFNEKVLAFVDWKAKAVVK